MGFMQPCVDELYRHHAERQTMHPQIWITIHNGKANEEDHNQREVPKTTAIVIELQGGSYCRTAIVGWWYVKPDTS